MLQRKQSLYLFLAGIFIFLMFFIPYWKTSDPNHEVLYYAHTIYSSGPEGIQLTTSPAENSLQLLLLVLVCVSIALSLLIIFMYQNRVRQAGLTMILLLVQVLTGIAAGWIMLQTETALSEAGTIDLVSNANYGSFLPLMAILLTWQARKAIVADEALVRSVDRIR